MSLVEFTADAAVHPVDVVEQFALHHDLSFERSNEDELHIAVTGKWTSYHVSFTWMDTIEALHVACAFDIVIPERCRAELLQLIAFANEQLWVGHFDMWSKDGVIMFRHALVLPGGAQPSDQQCETLLHSAVEACERYYQALQFVIWAGRSAREAIDATLFETVGHA